KNKGILRIKNLLGSPYSLKENIGWFKRYVCGPSMNNHGNVQYISKSSVLNKITPKYTISFIGDIMDLNLRNLRISESVKKFVKGSDFLIGNFEAILTSDKKLINGKRHKPQIMRALENLFNPRKTFLSTANNHSGDYGEKSFQDSVKYLEKKGFNIFGTKKTPFLDLTHNLRVIGSTKWSNCHCDYLTKLEDATRYLKEDSFNLLFPHWGYEMELYPRTGTIGQGMKLLKKFDAIIGHHSHCPQPVSYIPIGSHNKLIAYSLGDFCDGKKFEMHRYGIIIKIEIGTDVNGKWQVGKCAWNFLKTHSLSETEFIVEIVENFSNFLFTYESLGGEYKTDGLFSKNYSDLIPLEVCV
ncbi:MAG: CapA family protein, partial [Candidatus Odinarchaeota archaeon]